MSVVVISSAKYHKYCRYLFPSTAEHGSREGEVGPPPLPLPAPGAPKMLTQDEAAKPNPGRPCFFAQLTQCQSINYALKKDNLEAAMFSFYVKQGHQPRCQTKPKAAMLPPLHLPSVNQ